MGDVLRLKVCDAAKTSMANRRKSPQIAANPAFDPQNSPPMLSLKVPSVRQLVRPLITFTYYSSPLLPISASQIPMRSIDLAR